MPYCNCCGRWLGRDTACPYCGHRSRSPRFHGTEIAALVVAGLLFAWLVIHLLAAVVVSWLA